METITEQLILEAAKRLGEAAPGSQIVLFGSNARGEATEHSDVDFLVIEPRVSNGAEESVRLRRALWGMRIPTDIIVVSREFAEQYRNVRGSLVHAALSEGRTLVAS
jgi:predicted nucleotidyltransferase